MARVFGRRQSGARGVGLTDEEQAEIAMDALAGRTVVRGAIHNAHIDWNAGDPVEVTAFSDATKTYIRTGGHVELSLTVWLDPVQLQAAQRVMNALRISITVEE